MPISSNRFFKEYAGHNVNDLKVVHDQLRASHPSIIFLAGDSSLDNKFWFETQADATNGYEQILDPPRMKQDVCYWFNRLLVERHASPFCCLNTAVEGSTLNGRACGMLYAQDEFIQDHITSEDYLVVSVGGNDIAEMPLLCTLFNLAVLSWCVPVACLEHCACACPVNTHMDCGCFCCGLPGCITGCLCGWPPGIGYFVDLFKNQVEGFVSRLVKRAKPKKVIVCMLYYLDEASTGSWADCMLGCLCYDCCPYRLQSAISTMYRLATQRIKIEGTEVVAFPLFDVLDGKNTADYVQRVEPSPAGGRRMAARLLDQILD